MKAKQMKNEMKINEMKTKNIKENLISKYQ